LQLFRIEGKAAIKDFFTTLFEPARIGGVNVGVRKILNGVE
jgi:hypothetical protein